MSDPATAPLLRILLVEDSPRIAERLRDMLEVEPGLQIIDTVADEASAIVAASSGNIDVMILDLQLRSGTGFGVLRALGAKRPTTIVMTNYSLPQYRRRAQDLGAEHFLDKSVDLLRLPEILGEIRRLRNA